MSGADAVTTAKTLTDTLNDTYLRDQRVWDSCASIYENRIVGGHPDVTAYEALEEDLFDRVLLYLARDCGKNIHLYDVGCGSGRLHLRYALKTTDVTTLPPAEAEKIHAIRRVNPVYAYDPLLAERLHSVGGIDFSSQMLDLARAKLCECGCSSFLGNRFDFDHGSAFDLKPMPRNPLPVVASVCNSIGVMQGPAGAIELFKSVRRAVEDSGGIAILSAYRQEAVGSYALGNYESTMDVCGQPRWLSPDTYASGRYTQVPRRYKRAHDADPTVTVDVYDSNCRLVKEGHVLTRNESAVRATLDTGHIRTHTDYESHWYSFDLFDQWIQAHWPAADSYHIAGSDIDSLRGEPVQFAILDPSGLLRDLLERWNAK